MSVDCFPLRVGDAGVASGTCPPQLGDTCEWPRPTSCTLQLDISPRLTETSSFTFNLWVVNYSSHGKVMFLHSGHPFQCCRPTSSCLKVCRTPQITDRRHLWFVKVPLDIMWCYDYLYIIMCLCNIPEMYISEILVLFKAMTRYPFFFIKPNLVYLLTFVHYSVFIFDGLRNML